MPGGYHARCQGCDYEQSVSNRSDYAYRLADPYDIILRYTFAWCNDCRLIVSAEHLQSEKTREEPVADRTNRNLVRNVRRFNQDVRRYNEMLASRRSPPRCLKCGGVNIDPVSGQSPPWTVRHPACGGALQIDGRYYSRDVPETDVYSTEGEFLERVGGILLPGRGY